MTRFSDKTYTSLRVTEGYIPVIYSDSEGVPTVGLGCALVIYAPTASGNNEYKWKVRDNIDKILENIDGIEAIAEIKTKLQRAANILNGIELGSNDFLPSSEFYDEKGKLKEDIVNQERQKYGYISEASFKRAFWNGNVGLDGNTNSINLFKDYENDVIASIGEVIWKKLSENEKVALYSLHYNGPTHIDDKINNALNLLTTHGTVSSNVAVENLSNSQYIGKISFLYELLYNSIHYDSNSNETKILLQRRRFFEAYEALGFHQKDQPKAKNANELSFPCSNSKQAKILISFLNEKKQIVENTLRKVGGFKDDPLKYLQGNSSKAVSILLSENGVSQYKISDLFKTWNIFTSIELNEKAGTVGEKSSITGSSLNDIIICEINDSLVSGNHNNTINAGSGNDIIDAGTGNDTLIGGTGRDILNGGTGADTYEFNIGDGYDVIKETGNETNFIVINASISSFEAFRLNINEVVLRSTVNDNHIRIQGSENFEIRFSDASTTLAVMLQENDQVPADTEVCPLNQTPVYVPSTGKQFIYLPENFQGVLDLRNLSSGVEVFGIAEETCVLLPSGVSIETDATTGKIILKNQGQTVGTLTGCAGGSDNAGMFVIGTGFLCRLDATGQAQIKWIERLSELRQDVRFYLSQNKETAENKRSPLAIDLDGDGVETVSVANGVHFDHDGNGFAEKSGWISADDALLVRDANEDGEINDGSELFGDQTVLSNGEKAANGFEALADLDSNKDGVFDGDDDAFGEVMIWQDKNQNGIAEYDELQLLEESGVTSINLDYQNQSVTDTNGNEHKQTGTAVNFDKTTSAVSDVWFKADYMDTQDKTEVEISAEIEALPDIKAFGNVHSLHTAMALDESDALKTLVEQYAAETNPVARETILLDLIYTWVGVIDVDPESRAAGVRFVRFGQSDGFAVFRVPRSVEHGGFILKISRQLHAVQVQRRFRLQKRQSRRDRSAILNRRFRRDQYVKVLRRFLRQTPERNRRRRQSDNPFYPFVFLPPFSHIRFLAKKMCLH